MAFECCGNQKSRNPVLRLRFAVLMSAIVFGVLLPQGAEAQVPQLNLTAGGQRVHIFPTTKGVEALAAAGTASASGLLYNGGPVMLSAKAYAIFWIPATLQTGKSTAMSSAYRNLQMNFLKDYPGHGVASNNTQYYQGGSTTRKYIQDVGGLAGSYVETRAYPPGGCYGSFFHNHNCLTDAQLQAEIKRVMAFKGWSGGMGNIFLLFTSRGEASCFGFGCSYTDYCAYHGTFVNAAGQIVIYSNQPYAEVSVCQASGVPSPNGNLAADAEVSLASHELTEAITDPLGTAWFDANGNEIADLCAYTYGFNGWDGGSANQMWNGHFYLLQMEYDNYRHTCENVGP
jgi:hypothetical protein